MERREETESNCPSTQIIEIVSTYFHSDLLDKETLSNRSREVLVPRQIAMYFIRKYTTLGYNEAGQLFNKTHATVINAEKQVKDLISFNKKIRRDVEVIEENIKKNVKVFNRKRDLLIYDIIMIINKMTEQDLMRLNYCYCNTGSLN